MSVRVERLRVFHPSGGPVLTKQSEKDSTDVNLIMDSWVHAGAAVAGHLNPHPGAYGDFSSGIGYHEALDAVRDAERSFAALPTKVRTHVDNDPGKFLDMCFDPERREELERLGIVEAQKPVVAPRVDQEKPVVPPKEGAPDKPAGPSVPDGAPREGSKSADPAGGLFD